MDLSSYLCPSTPEQIIAVSDRGKELENSRECIGQEYVPKEEWAKLLPVLYGHNRGRGIAVPDAMAAIRTRCDAKGYDFTYARFLAAINPDGQPPTPRMTRIALIQHQIQVDPKEPFNVQRQVQREPLSTKHI